MAPRALLHVLVLNAYHAHPRTRLQDHAFFNHFFFFFFFLLLQCPVSTNKRTAFVLDPVIMIHFSPPPNEPVGTLVIEVTEAAVCLHLSGLADDISSLPSLGSS